MNLKKNNKKISSLKGMKDYIPKKSLIWNYLFDNIKNILLSYGFDLIKFPILENELLFNRSLKNTNNLINKEMYSFLDKNNKRIALRPEGTSCCIRFGIENGLLRGQKQKWWYFGPMFRYERPQLCRYREFYQLGIEAFGFSDSYIELELILLINKFFKNLNINNFLNLEINFLGSFETINEYSKYLKIFFEKNKFILNKELLKIVNNNPFSILETKNVYIKNFIINNINIIEDFLSEKSHINFNKIKYLLKNFNISYKINPFLVRGLDYYNDIVFEWKTDKLGSQSTICAGGRYDNLTSMLGGIYTPGIGLAIGWDRLIELFIKINGLNLNKFKRINILLSYLNNDLIEYTIKFSEEIRNLFLNIIINLQLYKSNLSKKIKFAINNNFLYIIIVYEINVIKEIFLLKDIKKNKKYFFSKKEIFDFIKNLNNK